MSFSFKSACAAAAIALALGATPALAASAQALIAKAHAAEAKGHLDDATVLMQAAAVADPARPATWVALGDFYARHHDPHFAHKYYDEALYLDPALPAALEGAGRADLALGDRKAAEDKLTRLNRACGGPCAEAKGLQAALSAAPAPADSAAHRQASDAPLDKE